MNPLVLFVVILFIIQLVLVGYYLIKLINLLFKEEQ